ncbi:ERF family protein [Endozoicomonas sp. SCSIO W0465]|uniref:ERF family protein n=1 Tax=Endozoicomonas sp. SCSIO W0465 TaxID=2918516 RepID=UPI0020762DD3|nr:ERF family protein [Endozoicomonas sp. SCSIO W0465]USE36913.1 ERF family protein [Endozoicomonas sp. SCSIO W0465]
MRLAAMPAKKKEQQRLPEDATPMVVPDTRAISDVGLLLNIALEKGSSIETLERVMKLYEQGQEILAKQQFNHAFAAFQKELPAVKKSKKTSFTTSKGGMMSYTYASMDDVVQAVQPVLHKFGLSYWFEQSQEQVQTQQEVEQQHGIIETRPVTVTVITITCHLGHVSGHAISNTVSGPVDASGRKNPIQQMSSAVTYLKRIALVGILGAACTDEDVDGYAPDVPTDKPSVYPDEDYQRNLPDWTARIESGRNTVEDIIINAESRAPLSPQQVQHLQSIQQEGQ